MVKATSTVTIGASVYSAADIEFSGVTAPTGISGAFHSCGAGAPGEFPAAVAGKIAVIRRGTITFAEKVHNAMTAGAAAAIIYDNNTAAVLADGDWSLGTNGNWIPALQVTAATGQAILSRAGSQATVINWRDPSLAYKFADGTSMAAPHVSGAIAFAALNFPADFAAQRKARILNSTTRVDALAGRTLTGGRLNLLTIVDTDTDGLPDWWEREHFQSLTPAAAADPDGDGFDNAREFLAGTSPAQGGSVPGFTSLTRRSAPDNFVLTFPTLAGRSYQVEWSSSLRPNSWLPLGTPFPGTGAAVEVTDPAPGGASRFYRLRIDAE
jgi:subtilisin family serine protease